jgi:hypothetical protein
MAQHLPRSLKHEYSLYVEREIEDYKDSVPRSVLLGIGDEAVAELAKQPQIELDELVLWDEVDRIIKRRLRIPTYQTWRRRRLKMLEQYRRPEHWGLAPDGPLVRAIQGASDTHVLVTGSTVESAALYFAAHGCEVTAVEQERDVVERVVWAAEAVGLAGRVHGCIADLVHWSPESPLDAVVCTPASFAGLTVGERERVISLLQGATTDGGVHLVQTIVAGQTAMTLDELEARYTGWAISVEPETASKTFLARKAVA